MTDASAHSGDPVPRPHPDAELRASHDDREAVAEQLREAAGDGRIDLAELEERLEKAFAAKTYGELEPLTADLPGAGAPAAGPEEPVVLRSNVGELRHTGHWVVPRHLVVRTVLGGARIDFTAAECRHREVLLELDAGVGDVTVIVPRGWSVQAHEVTVALGQVRNRANEAPEPGAPALRVTGRAGGGTVTVRHPFRWPGRRSRG
ncbi:hypothetical protein CUT44_26840 [Streptomyces carminius]|uniref:DUF1707 domain-containing protein n=1 Tax=Streptomyces carminius TaxID=2665496 RepID=A0A2M8LS50_9ACTN|nr:DUF1707 domain-containing protein [Streptomyces carminius]PJE94775.1 hypothetical protein CUT44_26840 [Streptomyces carminius]